MDVRVMPFEIIYNTPKPTIITMGSAPRPVEEPQQAMAAVVPIPDDKPLGKPKPNRGRPKKMAKDKELDHESGGPETIRKDDAGEQGAIGSHGQNAPAQQKVPEKPAGEGKDNA